MQVFKSTIRSVMDYGCKAIDLGGERIKRRSRLLQFAATVFAEPALHPYKWSVETLPMTYHALNSIANYNETKSYFLLDEKKIKHGRGFVMGCFCRDCFHGVILSPGCHYW